MTTVTYEEINIARDNFSKAQAEFNSHYYYFLCTVLQEAGVYNKLVRIKSSNVLGQFQVAEEPSVRRPFEINFFPLTKDGRVSLRSKYLRDFYRWKEDSLVQQLKEIAEVVGDLP